MNTYMQNDLCQSSDDQELPKGAENEFLKALTNCHEYLKKSVRSDTNSTNLPDNYLSMQNDNLYQMNQRHKELINRFIKIAESKENKLIPYFKNEQTTAYNMFTDTMAWHVRNAANIISNMSAQDVQKLIDQPLKCLQIWRDYIVWDINYQTRFNPGFKFLRDLGIQEFSQVNSNYFESAQRFSDTISEIYSKEMSIICQAKDKENVSSWQNLTTNMPQLPQRYKKEKIWKNQKRDISPREFEHKIQSRKVHRNAHLNWSERNVELLQVQNPRQNVSIDEEQESVLNGSIADLQLNTSVSAVSSSRGAGGPKRNHMAPPESQRQWQVNDVSLPQLKGNRHISNANHLLDDDNSESVIGRATEIVNKSKQIQKYKDMLKIYSSSQSINEPFLEPFLLKKADLKLQRITQRFQSTQRIRKQSNLQQLQEDNREFNEHIQLYKDNKDRIRRHKISLPINVSIIKPALTTVQSTIKSPRIQNKLQSPIRRRNIQIDSDLYDRSQKWLYTSKQCQNKVNQSFTQKSVKEFEEFKFDQEVPAKGPGQKMKHARKSMVLREARQDSKQPTEEAGQLSLEQIPPQADSYQRQPGPRNQRQISLGPSFDSQKAMISTAHLGPAIDPSLNSHPLQQVRNRFLESSNDFLPKKTGDFNIKTSPNLEDLQPDDRMAAAAAPPEHPRVESLKKTRVVKSNEQLRQPTNSQVRQLTNKIRQEHEFQNTMKEMTMTFSQDLNGSVQHEAQNNQKSHNNIHRIEQSLVKQAKQNDNQYMFQSLKQFESMIKNMQNQINQQSQCNSLLKQKIESMQNDISHMQIGTNQMKNQLDTKIDIVKVIEKHIGSDDLNLRIAKLQQDMEQLQKSNSYALPAFVKGKINSYDQVIRDLQIQINRLADDMGEPRAGPVGEQISPVLDLNFDEMPLNNVEAPNHLAKEQTMNRNPTSQEKVDPHPKRLDSDFAAESIQVIATPEPASNNTTAEVAMHLKDCLNQQDLNIQGQFSFGKQFGGISRIRQIHDQSFDDTALERIDFIENKFDQRIEDITKFQENRLTSLFDDIEGLRIHQGALQNALISLNKSGQFRRWLEGTLIARVQKAIHAQSSIYEDWELMADFYRQYPFYNQETITECCDYFLSKWVYTPQLSTQGQKWPDKKNMSKNDLKRPNKMVSNAKIFSNFIHSSPIILQILSALKKLLDKTFDDKQNEIHSDEELKQQIYIQLNFLEAFQFNNLNLLICEKSLAISLLSTLILGLSDSRRRCRENENKLNLNDTGAFKGNFKGRARREQGTDSEESTMHVLESSTSILAAMLRNEGCAHSLLKSKDPEFMSILNIFMDETSNTDIIEQGFIIVRLLLQSQNCFKLFVKRFPNIDDLIQTFLRKHRQNYGACAHLIQCKYLILKQGQRGDEKDFRNAIKQVLQDDLIGEIKEDMKMVAKLKSDDELISQLYTLSHDFMVSRQKLPIGFYADLSQKFRASCQGAFTKIKKKNLMVKQAKVNDQLLVKNYNPRIDKKGLEDTDQEQSEDDLYSSSEEAFPSPEKRMSQEQEGLVHTRRDEESAELQALKQAMRNKRMQAKGDDEQPRRKTGTFKNASENGNGKAKDRNIVVENVENDESLQSMETPMEMMGTIEGENAGTGESNIQNNNVAGTGER